MRLTGEQAAYLKYVAIPAEFRWSPNQFYTSSLLHWAYSRRFLAYDDVRHVITEAGLAALHGRYRKRSRVR